MESKRRNTTLGEICRLVAGSAFPQKYQGRREGIPFVKVSDMNLPKNEWEITVASNYVDRDTLSIMKAKTQPRGATVFAKIGEALRFNRMRMLTNDTAIDNNMMAAIPNSDINEWFLYYLISSLQLSRYAEGSALPYLKQSTLNKTPVVIPNDEAAQRQTSRVLYALDRKMQLNNQINGYLEELIDSKFSEDFGNGCPLVKLGEVLRISTESVNPRQHAEEMWEHYSIPAFDNSHQPTFELASNIKSNKYVVSRNSILISKLNPSIKRFWLPACSTQHAVCSTEFIVYETKNPAHKSFYAAALSSDAFQKYLLAHVTGSTGSRQRTQPKSTLEYPMPHPSEADIDEFCAFADPIYTRIECNERESAGLSQLRNALLPKLMSGEIDVSKVEVPTQPNSHLSGC